MAALEQFLIYGKTIEDVTVLGKNVTMKVLSSGEQQEVLETMTAGSELAQASKLMVETLARATIGNNGTKISYKDANGEPLTKEDTIKKNVEMFQTFSPPVVAEFWSAYQSLLDKQQKQIDNLKKVQTSSGQEVSGGSPKQSESKKSFPSIK